MELEKRIKYFVCLTVFFAVIAVCSWSISIIGVILKTLYGVE